MQGKDSEAKNLSELICPAARKSKASDYTFELL